MGEIADQMINGSMCHQCGVYLEPKETVYLVYYQRGQNPQTSMPSNGEYGVPVYCLDCHRDNKKSLHRIGNV